MDSCLGIVCYLSTGSKCAAHMVSVDERGEAAQMLALKAKISAEGANVSVSKILITGNTDAWGARGDHIESIFTLAQRFPAPPALNVGNQQRYLVQRRSILWNEDRAKNALSLYYHCPTAQIEVIPQQTSPADVYEEARQISEEPCA